MHYNWIPQKYADHAEEQYNWAITELQKIELIDKNILDIGCGDGKITAYLSKNTTGIVLGIDKSESMIEYAKENHIHSNLDFSVDDAENIKCDNKFDIVVSFNTLH